MLTHKTLGIIGGYGYNATIHFQNKLSIEINNIFNTRNYIKTIVFNDSNLFDNGEKPDTIYQDTIDENKIKKKLSEYYQNLVDLNASLIVIPCNSYSSFLSEEADKKKSIPVLNIIDVTCNYINQHYQNISKIGLIATKQTIKTNKYQKNLKMEVVTIEPESIYDIYKVLRLAMYGYYKKKPNKEVLKILGIKEDISAFSIMNKMVNAFLNKGIYHIILGCTELPLVIDHNKNKFDSRAIFISTTDILVKKVIEKITT
jgi:aspartate racemase